MLTIYHNPRCSKSRQALSLIQSSGKKFTIREYLKQIPDLKELENIANQLDIPFIEALRKNESEFITHISGKNLNNAELFQLVIRYPILLERPIVSNGEKAIIARPPDRLHSFL